MSKYAAVLAPGISRRHDCIISSDAVLCLQCAVSVGIYGQKHTGLDSQWRKFFQVLQIFLGFFGDQNRVLKVPAVNHSMAHVRKINLVSNHLEVGVIQEMLYKVFKRVLRAFHLVLYLLARLLGAARVLEHQRRCGQPSHRCRGNFGRRPIKVVDGDTDGRRPSVHSENGFHLGLFLCLSTQHCNRN